LIVGVVDDPVGARTELRDVYPFNLCVVQVELSMARLLQVEEALGPASVAWRPNVDLPANRVVIELAYVDEAAAERVSGFGESVLFDPIAFKVGP
jgi:hypothetical protein